MFTNGMTKRQKLAFNIANLGLSIDCRDSYINLAVPFIYEKFQMDPDQITAPEQLGQNALSIKITQNTSPVDGKWGDPICQTEIWALWKTADGDHVFFSPRQSPKKWVVIDPDFSKGEVIGDFSKLDGKPCYPLSSIDIRVVVNWLAQFGDLLLHAAGVAYQGQGYCFVGQSGKGKSTIAENLLENTDIEILGEDQVILRYLDGQYWIFGTPWHERDEMCSPIGVPLKKIFFLDREGKPGVAEITSVRALAALLQTAFIPYYLPDKMPVILERLAELCQEVMLHQYHYQLESDPLIYF
jgi:hypothetical protein